MIRLVRTCEACPEQYDAYDGELKVGYLRLRHGVFDVYSPGANGVVLYSASPQGDGRFLENERDYHLRFAVEAIERWQRNQNYPPPNVEYEIETSSGEEIRVTSYSGDIE